MCKQLDFITLLLVIVGGINWLLVGACNFNLVTYLLGTGTMLTRVVYGLVGISAAYLLFRMKKFCS